MSHLYFQLNIPKAFPLKVLKKSTEYTETPSQIVNIDDLTKYLLPKAFNAGDIKRRILYAPYMQDYKLEYSPIPTPTPGADFDDIDPDPEFFDTSPELPWRSIKSPSPPIGSEFDRDKEEDEEEDEDEEDEEEEEEEEEQAEEEERTPKKRLQYEPLTPPDS